MKRSLKGIRVDLGLTQEDMAKAMGVSKVTWNKKEKGKVPLLALELIRISDMSNVPMSEIEVLK
jgi:DNA-binding XRE family transcriptional regulator